MLETLDDQLEYIDQRWPRPALQYFDPDADDATADLFSKFAFFIKEVRCLCSTKSLLKLSMMQL